MTFFPCKLDRVISPPWYTGRVKSGMGEPTVTGRRGWAWAAASEVQRRRGKRSRTVARDGARRRMEASRDRVVVWEENSDRGFLRKWVTVAVP
jgi:hypothetical protein